MSQILPPLNLIPCVMNMISSPGSMMPLSGDVIGTCDNNTVIKVEGNNFEAVTYGTNQDGYVLTWTNKNNQIEAKSTSHPAIWNQEQWWIDPVNGNDNNDGLTQATAIKTAREYRRRVGPEHLFDRNIVMTIMSDLPDTDFLDLSGVRLKQWNPFNSQAFFFTVRGLPTVVTSGVATIRDFNQSANIPHGLSCSTIGSFASHVLQGRMVRKTSGTNSTDSIDWNTKFITLATSAWLAKNEDGTIARMSFPAYLDDLHFSQLQCGQESIANGDTFDIIDLCKIPVAEFPVHGVGVRFIRLNFTQAKQTAPIAYGGIIFIECSTGLWLFGGGTQSTKLSNCQANGFPLIIPHGASVYCTHGLMRNVTFGLEGRLLLQNYTLLQGCTTWINSSEDEGFGAGISCHTRGFGVYDSPVSGLLIPMGQVWQIAGSIYGSGNAGYAIEVMPGGKLLCQASSIGDVFYLTGNTGEIKVGGRTSGPAVDTVSPWPYTTDRAYTLANLKASVAAGGFNYNIFDPLNPSTAIVRGNF